MAQAILFRTNKVRHKNTKTTQRFAAMEHAYHPEQKQIPKKQELHFNLYSDAINFNAALQDASKPKQNAEPLFPREMEKADEPIEHKIDNKTPDKLFEPAMRMAQYRMGKAQEEIKEAQNKHQFYAPAEKENELILERANNPILKNQYDTLALDKKLTEQEQKVLAVLKNPDISLERKAKLMAQTIKGVKLPKHGMIKLAPKQQELRAKHLIKCAVKRNKVSALRKQMNQYRQRKMQNPIQAGVIKRLERE